MNEVFAKTRELGDALLRSEVYQALEKAQEAINADEQAVAMLDEYGKLQNEIGELLQSEQADTASITQKNDRMMQLQQLLAQNDTFAQFQQAQSDFSALVGQVNQILRFMITGEFDEPSGCSPDACASCGGGCHR